MKQFMIDIETTGIGSLDNVVLQIGVLECTFNGDKWVPGRTFEHLLHTERKPVTPFALEHMQELYARCNDTDPAMSRPALVRAKLLTFFLECGEIPPNVYLMGWNASNFDVPFLFDHAMLEPSAYKTVDGKEIMTGDVHYRIYELGGALQLARDVTGMDAKDVIEAAKERCPEIVPPKGKEHDAIFDCYNQLKILNGLIRLVRK